MLEVAGGMLEVAGGMLEVPGGKPNASLIRLLFESVSNALIRAIAAADDHFVSAIAPCTFNVGRYASEGEPSDEPCRPRFLNKNYRDRLY